MDVTSELAAAASMRVRNDLDAVSEACGLEASERRRLAAVVVGAVTGNRDRPLFLLARAIAERIDAYSSAKGTRLLFSLLSSANGTQDGKLERSDRALLEFLASMDDYQHFEPLAAALDTLSSAPEDAAAIRSCASEFARCLYRYRVEHLPTERHRSRFTDLRTFYQSHRPNDPMPRDGDALVFWCREADRSRWTTYETVLGALISYVEAAEIARAADEPESLDESRLEERSELEPLAAASHDKELTEIVEIVCSSSLKLFKKTELAQLERFARLGRFASTWPRSSLILFAFGPFQASLVQLERHGGSGTKRAQVAACTDGATYADLHEEFSIHAVTARDSLAFLYHLSQEAGGSKNAPENPMSDPTIAGGVKAMQRRNSFKNRNLKEIREELERLAPALMDMKGALDRSLQSWMRQLERVGDGGFEEDRSRFATKLTDLYILQNGRV